MSFPQWFKYIWWGAITLALSILLLMRIPSIVAGNSTAADVLLLTLWLALALAPLFQQISLPGVSLRQEIEDFRREVKQELTNVRTTIASTVDVRTNIYPTPPSDMRLPEIEERVSAAVNDAFERYGIPSPKEKPEPELPYVDENTQFLMMARYSLEKEIRRIWQERFDEEQTRRPLLFHRLVQDLASIDVIDAKLGHLMREVYSVCSPAVHGEPVSQAKVGFVGDTVPELLALLRAI